MYWKNAVAYLQRQPVRIEKNCATRNPDRSTCRKALRDSASPMSREVSEIGDEFQHNPAHSIRRRWAAGCSYPVESILETNLREEKNFLICFAFTHLNSLEYIKGRLSLHR